jgi:hypothetical protein
LSGSQLAELRLSRLQIERVKAFSEPAIDRSEKFARRVLGNKATFSRATASKRS